MAITKKQIENYLGALLDIRYEIVGVLGHMYHDSQEIRHALNRGEFPEEMFALYENRFRQALKVNSELVFCGQYLNNYNITGDKQADARVARAVKHFTDETQGRMFRHFNKTKTIEIFLPEKSKRRK